MAAAIQLKTAEAPSFVIEDGVPIPRTGSGASKGPNSKMGVLRRLNVGQSVFFAGHATSRMSRICWFIRKELPDRRLICRTVEGGCRVWRIA